MRNIVYFLTLVFLSSCNNSSDYKTVILKSTGIVETTPDEASLTINASCVNQDVVQARSCLSAISSDLNNVLGSFNIPGEDILTTNISLSKDYIWQNNSQVFTGYRAAVTTRVKVRDLSILDKLYTQLLGKEQLVIGSLTYSHSKIDSINDAAYLKALENANNTADRILSKLQQKNKEIIRISNIELPESEIEPVMNLRKFTQNEAAVSDQVIMNIGNVTAIRDLFVEYRLY